MSRTEAELKLLMVAGMDGDSVAHKTLLSRLSRHLRAYYKGQLARVGRSTTEAEDLVQETLMAIHTRRHTYDTGEPFTPWVYAIARYKLIDHMRATRASMRSVPVENAAELFAQDDYVGVESAHDLVKLMATLPDKLRDAVKCVKLDGLSVSEAARVCGTSEAAIKVNVHRALKAMAAAVAQKVPHEH